MTSSRQGSPAFRVVTFTAVLLTGCATTADIYLKHDRVVVGEIVEADSERVWVRQEVNDGVVSYLSFKETELPRQQIVSVDHPGNMMLAAGLITAGFGAGIAKANSKDCGATTADIPCQLSHAPLITGIIMSFWGLAVWLRSTSAYMPKIVRPRSSRSD